MQPSPGRRLVLAFIQRVSGGNPLFVGDFATITTHDGAKSVAEALRIVDDIMKQGGRPGLGLMAIPVEWAALYNRSPADLFDACTNISIGTDVMSAYAADCAGRRSRRVHDPVRKPRSRRLSLEARRACILRRFDIEFDIRGYPTGVLSELAKLAASRRGRATDPPPPSRAHVFPDDTDHAGLQVSSEWSNTRLYFYSPTATLSAPSSDMATLDPANWAQPTTSSSHVAPARSPR